MWLDRVTLPVCVALTALRVCHRKQRVNCIMMKTKLENCIIALTVKNLSKFIEPEDFSVFITGRNKYLYWARWNQFASSTHVSRRWILILQLMYVGRSSIFFRWRSSTKIAKESHIYSCYMFVHLTILDSVIQTICSKERATNAVKNCWWQSMFLKPDRFFL